MDNKRNITADEALQRPIDGNQRFLNGELYLSGFTGETIAELAKGQHPLSMY